MPSTQYGDYWPGDAPLDSPGELRILLVEDSATDAHIIRLQVTHGLSESFTLKHVQSVTEACQALDEARFDLILLDLTLPDSTGLNTLATVQRHAQDDTLVVLTGGDDSEMAIEAVRQGAQGYLLKAELGPVTLAREVRFAIERNRRRKAERKLQVAEAELQLARRLQTGLYPHETPQIDGFDIAGDVWPATQACGDYFDFLSMKNELQGIVVGDVSGHGLGAALKMVEARACLRCLTPAVSDLPDLVEAVHRVFTGSKSTLKDAPESTMFLTLFLALIDPVKKTLTYCGAGHSGYLLKANGQVQDLESLTIPVGFDLECAPPRSLQTQLHSGDVVLIPTDGFQEAGGMSGRPFGIQRMLELVQEHRDLSAREILERLYDASSQHAATDNQEDDMSGVVIRVA